MTQKSASWLKFYSNRRCKKASYPYANWRWKTSTRARSPSNNSEAGRIRGMAGTEGDLEHTTLTFKTEILYLAVARCDSWSGFGVAFWRGGYESRCLQALKGPAQRLPYCRYVQLLLTTVSCCGVWLVTGLHMLIDEMFKLLQQRFKLPKDIPEDEKFKMDKGQVCLASSTEITIINTSSPSDGRFYTSWQRQADYSHRWMI